MKQRNRPIPGPDLDAPFRVVEGVVVIQLMRGRSLVIPAGGAWPGLEQLPEHVLEYLQPIDASNTPGTITEPSGETDRQAALALVIAQGLSAVGTIAERIRFAEQLNIPIRTMNQFTGSGMIGVQRESFSKAVNG